MKIKILLAILLFSSSVVMAQSEDENEKRVYNYEETKHELAVSLLPILRGEVPSSLFYRKNYLSPKGRNMGFRMNMVFQNEFNSNFLFEEAVNFRKNRELTYEITMGLERQKFINDKFIAYGGVDLGFGFANARFFDRIGQPAGESEFFNIDVMRYSAANFWGVKYHFNPRLSFSAETGFEVFYANSVFKNGSSFTPTDRESGPETFGLNLLPLKALRISYHF
jgi:hypothetical protein